MDANELRVVTVCECRKQCSIDWNDDDQELETMALAAEDAVINGTRRTYDELCVRGYQDKTGDTTITDADDLPDGNWFPPMLKRAILLLVATMYRHREPDAPVAVNMVPFSYHFLVKPYRKLVDDEESDEESDE